MNKKHQAYHGRSHTHDPKPATTTKPRISVAERRARKARKQLIKLFPHLAPRLHKNLSPESIYQHACTLAQAPTGSPPLTGTLPS